MLHEDLVVFAHPDGKDYVAHFEEHGWLRWPAEAHGFAARHPCPEGLVDECEELEPRLAALALRLSGAVDD